MTLSEQLADVDKALGDFNSSLPTSRAFTETEKVYINGLRQRRQELVLEMAKEWEAKVRPQIKAEDSLEVEETVKLPKSVLELILLWFESGLSRDEHLVLAAERDDRAHLRAIDLCFNER